MFEESKRFERSTDKSGGGGLTLAPMIDVVFLLLIFFMVSTTFISRPGLKINLPESDATAETPTERWVVSVAQTGQLYLDKNPVALPDLKETLRRNPKPVLIRADETISHGTVVAILDGVRSAGIESVNLSTEKPETNPGGRVNE
jgi:biopolymer transport protein ExbD